MRPKSLVFSCYPVQAVYTIWPKKAMGEARDRKSPLIRTNQGAFARKMSFLGLYHEIPAPTPLPLLPDSP